MIETVQFYLKLTVEYMVTIKDDRMKCTPMYVEQESQIIFSFIRQDGNERKLKEFLSITYN